MADDITEFDPNITRQCEKCRAHCAGDVPLEYINKREEGDDDLSTEQLRVALKSRPGMLLCPRCAEYAEVKRKVVKEQKKST